MIDLNTIWVHRGKTIIRAVDNLIVGLNIKIKNIREREQQTSRISAVPTQQKYVLSVERQQKIKEELYPFLLNNAKKMLLSQAITENARIIDPGPGEASIRDLLSLLNHSFGSTGAWGDIPAEE